MKKLLSIIAISSILTSSFSTVSCTYADSKELAIVSEINDVINTSSLVARSSLEGSIKTDDTLKTSTNILNNMLSQQADDLLGTNGKYNNTLSGLLNNYFHTTDHSILIPGSPDPTSSSIVSTLSTISEAINLLKLPLSSTIFTTINSLITSNVGGIADFLNNILYSNSSTFFDESSFININSIFKPLIPLNSNITNKDALVIAFYNAFHVLSLVLPPDLGVTDKFSQPFFGKLPDNNFADYQQFAWYLAKNISSINFSAVLLNILPSIFVFINYFNNFFDVTNNRDIHLSTDKELSVFNVPMPNDSAFNYLFSTSKTNSQMIEEINNSPFKSGVSADSFFSMINNLFSNDINGISLDRIMIILTGDFSDNKNYSSLLQFILDFSGGIINSKIPTIDPSIWRLIENFLINDNVFLDLERNFTLNKILSDPLVEQFSKQIPFIQTILSLLKDNPGFYNNSNNKNDEPPKLYNSGSLSTLWNTDLVKQILQKIPNININLIGDNLPDILKNLFSSIKLNFNNFITNTSLYELFNIFKNIAANVGNNLGYIFSTNYIYQLLNDISCINDTELYSRIRQSFLTTLENNYSSSSILATKFNAPTYKELLNKTNIKNKSVIAYYLYEVEDSSIASISDAENLIGISSNGTFENDSYVYNLANDLNNKSIKFFSGILNLLSDFISEISKVIVTNVNHSFDIADNPKNWLIENEKYDDPKLHDYKLPTIIYYKLIFNNPDDNKIYTCNVSLSLEKGTNYYSNIVIT